MRSRRAVRISRSRASSGCLLHRVHTYPRLSEQHGNRTGPRLRVQYAVVIAGECTGHPARCQLGFATHGSVLTGGAALLSACGGQQAAPAATTATAKPAEAAKTGGVEAGRSCEASRSGRRRGTDTGSSRCRQARRGGQAGRRHREVGQPARGVRRPEGDDDHRHHLQRLPKPTPTPGLAPKFTEFTKGRSKVQIEEGGAATPTTRSGSPGMQAKTTAWDVLHDNGPVSWRAVPPVTSCRSRPS